MWVGEVETQHKKGILETSTLTAGPKMEQRHSTQYAEDSWPWINQVLSLCFVGQAGELFGLQGAVLCWQLPSRILRDPKYWLPGDAEKEVKNPYLSAWTRKGKSAFENHLRNALEMKGQKQGLSYTLYDSAHSQQAKSVQWSWLTWKWLEAQRGWASSLGSHSEEMGSLNEALLGVGKGKRIS